MIEFKYGASPKFQYQESIEPLLVDKSEKKTERKKVIVNIDKKIEDKKQEVIQKKEIILFKKVKTMINPYLNILIMKKSL